MMAQTRRALPGLTTAGAGSGAVRTKRTAAKIARELALVKAFIGVYCHAHHHAPRRELCTECNALLAYATARLRHCPYDPKPACKRCPTHCYRAGERARMKAVMRFSGMHFVKRGRLDWLVKYFLS
jgi:hypothetical protein